VVVIAAIAISLERVVVREVAETVAEIVDDDAEVVPAVVV
jgi:hypothetical protein